MPGSLLSAMLRHGIPWLPVFAAQGLAIIGQFALIKVAAIFLDPAGFLDFVLIIATSAAPQILVFGPLSGAAQRYYWESKRAGVTKHYYGACLLISVLGSFVLILGYLAVRKAGTLQAIGLSSAHLDLGIVYGLLFGVSLLAVAIFNASLMKRHTAFFIIVQGWLPLAGFIAAPYLGLTTLENRVFAMILATAAAVAIGMLMLLRMETADHATGDDAIGGSRFPRDRSLVMALVRFSWPYVAWAPAAYLIGYADRWILAQHAAPVFVGSLAAMTLLSTGVMNVFTRIINRMLAPTAYMLHGRDDASHRAHALVAKSVTLIAAVGAALTVLVALFPKPLVSLISAPIYAEHSGEFWVLVIAATINSCARQEIFHGLVRKDHSRYVLLYYVHGGMLLGLLMLTVPSFGLQGVSYSLLASSCANFAMTYYVNWKARSSTG